MDHTRTAVVYDRSSGSSKQYNKRYLIQKEKSQTQGQSITDAVYPAAHAACTV